MRKLKKSFPSWAKVLIPAVLLLAAVGVLVGVKTYQDQKRKEEEERREKESSDFVYTTLWDLDVMDIKAINMTMGDRGVVSLCATHDDTHTRWYLPINPDADVDLCYSNVVSMAAMIQVYELICEDPTEEQLHNYGLTEPSAILEVELEDGTSKKMIVGDTAPAGTYMYIQMAGDNNVYSTSSSYKKYLNYKYEDLIGYDIDQVMWSATAMLTAHLYKKGEKEIFLLNYADTDFPDNYTIQTGAYAFYSPYSCIALLAVRGDVTEYFFGNLEDFDIVEIVNMNASEEDMIGYGLDERGPGYCNYYLAFEMVGQDVDEDGNNVHYYYTYLFGNTYGDNDEYIYVCEGGHNVVYGCRVSSLEQYDFKAYDYLRTNVFLTSVENIRSGYFDFAGERYEFTSEPYEVVNPEDLSTEIHYDVVFNGQKLKSDAKYRSLIGGDGNNWMRHNREVWDVAPDYSEDKDIVVHFDYADGTERTLVYHYLDEQSYCIQVQSDLWLICGSYQFKGFQEAARAVLE